MEGNESLLGTGREGEEGGGWRRRRRGRGGGGGGGDGPGFCVDLRDTHRAGPFLCERTRTPPPPPRPPCPAVLAHPLNKTAAVAAWCLPGQHSVHHHLLLWDSAKCAASGLTGHGERQGLHVHIQGGRGPVTDNGDGFVLLVWLVAERPGSCVGVSPHRLVGLVVRRPPRERKIPGSNPRLRRDFFAVESYQ